MVICEYIPELHTEQMIRTDDQEGFLFQRTIYCFSVNDVSDQTVGCGGLTTVIIVGV